MENAPDQPQASNDAPFGRLAIDPGRAKAVADWLMGAAGNYYGTIENAVHGGPIYPRDALQLGPGTMLPVLGRAEGLGALGGRVHGPGGMGARAWAEILRKEGKTNEEIADILTRYYSAPNVKITARDVAEDLGVTKGAAAAEADKVQRPKTGGRPTNPLKAPAMDELAARDQPLLGTDPRTRELVDSLMKKFKVSRATAMTWVMEYQGKGRWEGRALKSAPGPASISPPQAARAENTGSVVSKDPNQLTWDDILEPEK